MYWCCDCKNKYIKEKCDNCSKMDNYEKGNATVELLEKIKETFCDMRDGYPKITDETLTVREVIEVIDKRIKELNNATDN